MSNIENIPLSKLSISPLNVRATDTDKDVEALAASIQAHGLLQNLAALPAENGRYKIIAGGRRLRALKLLVKNGALAKDWPVPCRIAEEGVAIEHSLAENVQRVAMNAMDEVEAFERLVQEGKTPENIAQRFGVGLRHVEQRLALAGLSPRIRAAYRKGDLTLDVARVFCIAPDHAAQERVFKQFAKPITHAPSVRNALVHGRISVGDRIAKFVSVESYEKAGGRVTRDLFEDDQIYLDDGELLHELAHNKLEGLRASVKAEGWAWAEVQTGLMQIEGCASERLAPILKKPNTKLATAISELEAEIEALDGRLALEGQEEDALWDRREAAEAELAVIQDSLRNWDVKQMTLAGASIAIDRDGSALITRGLIKRNDLKALNKLRAKPSISSDHDNDETPPPALSNSILSRDLTEKLTAIRTSGLRAEIARSPHGALALTVFALLQQRQSIGARPGIGLRSTTHAFADHKSFKAARGAPERNAPRDLAAAFELPVETLLAMLAALVAETLNFTHRGRNH